MKVSDGVKAFIENDVYFYTVLIVVISVLSFGLGRLSVDETTSTVKQQITLTEQSATVSLSKEQQPIVPTEVTVGTYVASKKGSKYHLTTCPGAKQMSEVNKVYFQTEEDARASGYTRAKNCTF